MKLARRRMWAFILACCAREKFQAKSGFGVQFHHYPAPPLGIRLFFAADNHQTETPYTESILISSTLTRIFKVTRYNIKFIWDLFLSLGLLLQQSRCNVPTFIITNSLF